MLPVKSNLPILLVTCLIVFPGAALAQGFDASKVDWEKIGKIPMSDSFIKHFNENCGACHGEDLQGAPLGGPLVGVDLQHGDSVKEIANSIATGFPENGMPAWSETLSENRIWNLALYVAEQRQGTTILEKNDDIAVLIPEGTVNSERHSFRIEIIADGLDPMPFSIEPLPGGHILLSERMRGLSIISVDGTKSELIKGTPTVYADSGMFLGQVRGNGWMLDVAIHPDYEDNGWVYIHHTDRCTGCNEFSRRGGQPVSMNRVVRGRIKDGEWVDEEVIWQADIETYTNTSDLAAGGRLSFDADNHLYFSVGMKDVLDTMGMQDPGLPYGKIHRVNDDGSIPDDNPFTDNPDALDTIWTIGHRSSQGLEYNPKTGDHWETEMGPRGGDELNRLIRGGNYGWPVFTSGVNYDGRPVDVADKLGIELDPDDAEFPVVDWTPAIAISSFIFYDSPEFPGWNGNIIAGTLRATDLLRMEVVGNSVVHTEMLLENLARFRDIELGPNGELYVLLENKAGSQIIRITPAGRD
ncbi:MAG: PQQ-dependent sugar dehydrogenase [Gammaproteobacteria bacterium]|jgi:glucose/arabinose dehydrogenase|nr:PQQ-dependent sugar dehydrogenase [Gammaproteobacteria bacterium]MDP6617483.1 PQQ-dependent sugar dehydrogenase [Gammaproteobacteria bacterium]